MREYTVGLLAVALLCVTGASIASPIVYNVDISDETQSLTGTITTSGIIGPIGFGDITAWSFATSGEVQFSISSALCPVPSGGCDPGSFVFGNPPPHFFIATSSELRFDFADPEALAGFGFAPHPEDSSTVTFAPAESRESDISAVIVDLRGQPSPPAGRHQFIFPRSLEPIAFVTPSVPEPSTVLVLCLGLAGLGFACKRLRTQQTIPV
jgi:hypothetical protein